MEDAQATERDAHLFGAHPKRILSLDGGGVRGLITLGMLKRVEDILSARSPDPVAFRLSDYFDLIGGTSTGALIGTMLAMGVNVDRIIEIYFDMIPKIFNNPQITAGYTAKFEAQIFEQAINKTFDELLAKDLDRTDLLKGEEPHKEPRLSSNVLKTGLAVLSKRIDTNSVWLVTNNPRAKYWTPDNEFWRALPPEQRETFLPNADYPLRRIVRASASAPYFLDAVKIKIDEETTGLFLDGGVTPHNNPAAELFLTATLRGHNESTLSPTGFNWKTGADNLFILSLGAGTWRVRHDIETYQDWSTARQAGVSMMGMIADGTQTCLTWLQALSEPADPVHIDGNLGTMAGLRIVKDPLLTFQRINPTLELDWLRNNLGLDFDIDPEAIATMRALDVSTLSNLNRCYEVGLETGRRMIRPELFRAGFDTNLTNTLASAT